MILGCMLFLGVLQVATLGALHATTNRLNNSAYKARFENAMKLFESKDEEATIKLSIIDTDGSSKTREILVQRAGSGTEQRMMARILAPMDLKGTTLLSVLTKSNEDQWIYLPSTKQTRKIVTAEQKGGGILGSELRYEDFNPSTIRRSEIAFSRQESRDGKTFEIFETKIPAGLGPYQRAQVWIEIGKDLPAQIEYFSAC